MYRFASYRVAVPYELDLITLTPSLTEPCGAGEKSCPLVWLHELPVECCSSDPKSNPPRWSTQECGKHPAPSAQMLEAGILIQTAASIGGALLG